MLGDVYANIEPLAVAAFVQIGVSYDMLAMSLRVCLQPIRRGCRAECSFPEAGTFMGIWHTECRV